MKRNILLVEPDYRSKFPPLGLMRISSYHKGRGDNVTFVRGRIAGRKDQNWHRIYISSLFTWELPRTLKTIRYYQGSVDSPEDIVVGGVACTLLPTYLPQNVKCRQILGQLDKRDMLEPGSAPITDMPLDYELLKSIDYEYYPTDAYFVKTTKGCIRKCSFCAVPKLEPEFGRANPLGLQIEQVRSGFGEKQHLIVLDNNILGIPDLDEIIENIRDLGFHSGAKRNGRQRTVDFNQGIDCRLVTPAIAKLLSRIAVSPIRLAFDHDATEPSYRRAIALLASEGFDEFTNYILFNFKDAPDSLYRRLRVNIALCQEHQIRVTGFPMRFVPMDDVIKRHISAGWKWRYLRGVQCILLATRGLVSPNPGFFERAFGETLEEFQEITSMPDRYIIYRKHYEDGPAMEWRKRFRKLSKPDRVELLDWLEKLNNPRIRREIWKTVPRRFRLIAEHYYPGGKSPGTKPAEDLLSAQGLANGYDNQPPQVRRRPEPTLKDSQDSSGALGSSEALLAEIRS